MNNNAINKRGNGLRYAIKIAILSAIATVVMLFEFPLPFLAPSFYELDLSEAIIMMGSFAIGPIAGVIMELLKNLLNILFNGTTTAYVGEFANFVTGCSFILPAALIYKYNKTIKGAVIGMITGAVSLAAVGGVLNYFILIPAFSTLYGMSIEAIVGMATNINPLITDLKTMVIFAVAPFNLLKGIVCSIISLVLYKRISKILHI